MSYIGTLISCDEPGCSRKFATLARMQSHKSRDHKTSFPLQHRVEIQNASAGFYCRFPQCPFEGVSRTALGRHMRTHKQEAIYCSECHNVFIDSVDYETHLYIRQHARTMDGKNLFDLSS